MTRSPTLSPSSADDSRLESVPTPHAGSHLKVLDGWRGISIILVLLTHLAPIGRIAGTSAGIVGMAVFFNLSGFLITSFLLKKDASAPDFLVRRFFRVMPLTFLYLLVVFTFQPESPRSQLEHYLFIANLPPPTIRLATDPLWSLCVEVQFYVGIGLLFLALRQRGLLLLPLLAVFFTGLRVHAGVEVSSVTWFRVDEILAGCTLALLFNGAFGRPGEWLLARLRGASQLLLCLLLAACSLYGVGYGGWLNYFRPYVAALLIGATLLNPDTRLGEVLKTRFLAYLATISFAAYVLHAGLTFTWLSSGDRTIRYLKRPLLLLVLIVLAHLSTNYYERPAIAFGKRFARRLARRHPSTP